jgi:ABC-2 type transport system ATP-binding protein
MPNAIIKTENLTKVYTSKSNIIEAVKNLNLTINKGEIFGLLGPNGAGKTTTIKMLCTLLKPTSGTAYLSGFDVTKNPVDVKELIELVPERGNLMREFSVYETLLWHAKFFGMKPQQRNSKISELLERFQLDDRSRDEVGHLSKGMRQKLLICRALLRDPDILMLDEPTIGLDPRMREQMWKIMREINQDGKTILITTHYMEEAEELCQRVGFLNEGNLIAVGSPKSLINELDQPKIVEIRTKDPIDDVRIHSIESKDGVDRVEVTEGLINVFVNDPHRILASIIGSLENAQIDSIDIRVPSLRDVFLEFVRRKKR